MLTRRFYRDHIKGSDHKAPIVLDRDFLCNVGKRTHQIINKEVVCLQRGVYLTTKALKHIHDRHIYIKSTPEDFEIILENLHSVIKRPDFLYQNKPHQRADFLLVKNIDSQLFLTGIEIMNNTEIEIVSAFATDADYLKNFNQLWGGETANLSS